MMNKVVVASLFLITTTIGFSQGSETADIIDYSLELRIPFDHSGYDLPENMLYGQATIKVKSLPQSGPSVLLHRLLTVDCIFINSRKIDFKQGVTAVLGWEAFQVNHVSLPLREDEATITIYYHGHVTGYEETGMLYVKESLDPSFTIIRPESFTYPQLMEPEEKSLHGRWRGTDTFTQQISLNIPVGHYPAVADSVVVSDSPNGMKMCRWRNEARNFIIPIAPYQKIEKDNYTIFYFEEDTIGARRIAAGIDDVYQLYEKWMGPMVQRSHFTLAEIPENFGSQVTMPLIIQTAAAFKEPKAMGELYHEISHFWNVRDKEVLSPRWNEGLAMFLQYLAYESLNESGTLLPSLVGRLQRVKKYFAEHEKRIAIVDYGKEGVTSALSYSAGPLFFYVLGEVMGRDRLLSTLGEFYRKYNNTGAGPHDLPDFVMKADRRTKPVFQDWYYSEAYVDHIVRAEKVTDLATYYMH